MKIGVEASCLGRRQRTGVDYYTYCLLQAMIKQAPQHQFELEYFRFLTKPPVSLGLEAPNVRQHRVSLIPGKLYSALFKYAWAPPIDLLSGARGQVYLFPNFARWHLFFTRKSIVVIHDLAYHHAPEYVPERLRAYLEKYVPKALAQANHILAVSEFTKRDLIKTYSVAPERISVASNAVDHDFFYPRKADEVLTAQAKYGIEGSYIMFHGTIEPRKNLKGVMEAYRRLPAQLQRQYALVLTGGKGWLDDDIHQQIEDLKHQGAKVIQTGYVDQADLPALYTGASVFVWPSFYEGFGLPIIEAMACGTPTITSNVSSLPEAAGDAGMLVDPHDSDSIAKAMEQVLTSPAEARRMTEAGLKHVKKFNWEDSARAALQAIEQVAFRPNAQ